MRTEPVTKYYTSMDRMLDLFDKEARQMPVQTQSMNAYNAWKKATKKKLAEITGLSIMERCDLNPQKLETVKLEGMTREKWLIQTEPLVYMPFYVLVPDVQKPNNACIITPHGHEGGAKNAVSGRSEIPAIKDKIAEYGYDYGYQFAKQGYVVFSPDARNMGERRESSRQSDNEADFLGATCAQLNNMAICLNRTVTGMWVWDLMRLVDYIETRTNCDASKIGCAGLSGGGLQSLWFTAFDERVKCAIVSGYFYGYKDALLKVVNCACNYVPGLWKAVDMGDIAALIAPRPLLIETGDKDSLNGPSGVPNVTSQVDIAKAAYELFGGHKDIIHVVEEGEHKWFGNRSEWFMEEYL